MLSFLFLNPLIISMILMIIPYISKNFKDNLEFNSLNTQSKFISESQSFADTNDKKLILCKQIAYFSSIINLIAALIIWIRFDGNCYEYQFIEQWISINNYNLHVGIDGISLFFILLTTFIIPVCFLASWESIKKNIVLYYVSFLILEAMLIAVFIVLDLIFFYITFESCLIPMFLIIGIWGSRERKILASNYFFLYTLFGSLFMFLCIILINSILGTFDFQIIGSTEFSFETQQIIWLGFLLALAIKTPMIPFHLWLPEAHTEAPLGGSIILAGILLKLASYGFLRVSLQFLPDASIFFTPFILNLAIFSIILSSFTTFRQIDLKRMIAYSSIGHMGIINLGIFSNTVQGIEGAIILSLMHGIVSPALFICIGVLYDRYHIRLVKFYKGLTSQMPLFTMSFFIFILGNMAVPLTGNFIGEFLSFTGIFYKNPLFTLLAATSMILVSGYSIWVFNRVSFGNESKFILKAKDLTRRESFNIFILIGLTIFFGIYPNIILDSINFSVSSLLVNDISFPKKIYSFLFYNPIFFENISLAFIFFTTSKKFIKDLSLKIYNLMIRFKNIVISPFLTIYIPLNLYSFYIQSLTFIYFIGLFIFLFFLIYISKKYYTLQYNSFIKIYGLFLSITIFILIVLGHLKGLEFKELFISLGIFSTVYCLAPDEEFETESSSNKNDSSEKPVSTSIIGNTYIDRQADLLGDYLEGGKNKKIRYTKSLGSNEKDESYPIWDFDKKWGLPSKNYGDIISGPSALAQANATEGTIGGITSGFNGISLGAEIDVLEDTFDELSIQYTNKIIGSSNSGDSPLKAESNVIGPSDIKSDSSNSSYKSIKKNSQKRKYDW